jgi:phage repressor protein C with HTH and peptisase S24 domain
MKDIKFKNNDEKSDDYSSHTFGERVSVAIQRAGGATEMAIKGGFSPSVLRKWRSEQSDPSRKHVVKLAQFGGVSLEWLATGKGSPDGDIPAVAPLELEDYVFIPLYDARCGVDNGNWNEGSRVIAKLSFTQYSLRKQCLTHDRLSAIRIDGDSMEPILHSGDTVLIDHTSVTIEGEGIYVLRLDGHLYAKRLQRNFDGIVIISENKQYPSITVPSDRLNELDIVGRAVWSAGWL